jgi:hypothetical protein
MSPSPADDPLKRGVAGDWLAQIIRAISTNVNPAAEMQQFE